jgi:hypothetical protein
MVSNKVKLWAASSFAAVGLASVGVISFASAQTPPPLTGAASTTSVTAPADKEVNDQTTTDTGSVNDKSTVETDKVDNQQGDQSTQGPDTPADAETNDGGAN